MKRVLAVITTIALAATMLVSFAALPTTATTVQASSSKLVAFTFDDGPSQYTTQLLDGLQRLGAKATFFVNGNNGGSLGAAFHADKLARMVADGHQVANHTYQHYVPFDGLSGASVRSEVDKVNTYLYNAMGSNYQTLVRTPGGATSSTISANVNAPIILWSVDTLDWKYRNASTVYNNIINQVGDGSIVLLHDIYSTSVSGALSAMQTLKNAGYEFVTVSELFRRRGITMQNGTAYYSAGNRGTTLDAYRAPTIQYTAGNSIGKASVTLSAADSGLTLYYTTNGTAPTLGSSKYTGTFSAPYDTTITVAGFDKYGTRTPLTTVKLERRYEGVFDAVYYADHNEDLKAQYGYDEDKLLNHFLTQGLAEGREASPVFSIRYYETTYSDLQRAYGDDHVAYMNHFLRDGMREGRRASDRFDPLSYRLRYADLRRAYGNNWHSYYLHYLRNGYQEGRQTTGCFTMVNPATVYDGVNYAPVYDYHEFIAAYPEIEAAYPLDDIATLAYFAETGMREKMQGSSHFDVRSYYNRYPDLRRAFGSDWPAYYRHYIRHGQREGRETVGYTTLVGATTVYEGVNYAAVYDFYYYTAHHPDVLRAYGEDENAVIRHFVKHGMKEGRRASEQFDVVSYYNRYPDLRRAYGKQWASYYQHYLSHGIREKREATGCTSLMGATTKYNGMDYAAVYDFYEYLDANPDVARAFGEDENAVIKHFVQCGMKEGRIAKSSFHIRVYRENYADLRRAFGNDLPAYYEHYMRFGIHENRIAC